MSRARYHQSVFIVVRIEPCVVLYDTIHLLSHLDSRPGAHLFGPIRQEQTHHVPV
jgi:hypothetical protein